jgi:hypothetical protein
MGIFEFIIDKELEKTLEKSIAYIYSLTNQLSYKNNRLDQEETRRVIILYTVSTIEAILFYFYKEHGERITTTEYTSVQYLSKDYSHVKKNNLPVVIAVQEKIDKKEHQIGLFELVNFFKNKKLILEKTAVAMLEINDIRNTFHFNKNRVKSCDLKSVESALDLLILTIEYAPKVLKVK